MAEQTFRSPGFFEKEIDLSQREAEIVGVPAGVIGTAEMGPAFVPVTVGSFSDFEKRFGDLNTSMFGPYAVNEFFKHKTALTYVRVLGAGANETTTDIENTRVSGIVKNAGFRVDGSTENSTVSYNRTGRLGAVQFIGVRQFVSGAAAFAEPELSDNDSINFNSAQQMGEAFLIRGMIMCATGTRAMLLDYNQSYSAANVADDVAFVNPTSTDTFYKTFKLVLSSTAGATFSKDDSAAGIRIYTASLDPSSDAYISKILNTDPERFQKEQHLLYGHFPIEEEVASISTSNVRPAVAIMSGTLSTNESSGITSISYLESFGRFDTRYTTPKTTWFISQPYGKSENNLFYFETISDGAVANSKYKISISNVRKSTDPKSSYGTFSVEVREFGDTDTDTSIVERYSNCTLNPNDSDFIAKKIGDYKAEYNFDAESVDERKVVVSGKYPNVSSRIRVVMSNAVYEADVPESALPFGFRGFPSLKTTDTLTDSLTTALVGTYAELGGTAVKRLGYVTGTSGHLSHYTHLSSSILPPVPFRFKVTRGAMFSGSYKGSPGSDERVDSRLYWGTKFERVPKTSSMADALLNPNASSIPNPLIEQYTKFLGILKLDTLVTGAGADEFNNNKFTLARVALPNVIATTEGVADLAKTANTVLTGTAKEHILGSAYIRNGRPDAVNYTVSEDVKRGNRITLASVAAMTSSVYFNKFTEYTKFTNFMYGGFNGVNILDANMAQMDDKASSSDSAGMASISSPPASPDGSPLDIGLSTNNQFGAGEKSNIVASYRTAARILTDPMVSRVNILMIPGIRDGALTDFVHERLLDYSKAFYIQDLPAYDKDTNRLFGSSGVPNVTKTLEQLESRALDNNYSATYFPDVSIDDEENNTIVAVPASIAVIGALAYNDSIAYPWFAPAGFNRAALDFVTNVKVRLNQSDRDELYDARINPIATFPRAGFVIFGQKTLQMSKSALDRVNVRRMLLEVKRLVVDVANKIVFESNTPETRARFVSQVTPLLATVQSQQGIDQFKVVMDSSNNTQEDVEGNRLNGKIVVVPTRAVEFIAIDFIITNAGVSFE